MYIFYSIIVLLFMLANPAFGYDNEKMHQLINTNALKLSRVDQILRDQYGFSKGIKEKLNNRFLFAWTEKGGEKEDEPWIKVTNHFHDPTQSWSKTTDNAKLNYWIAYGSGARSSVRWAQDSWNSWSWQKAREKMYKGLTSISESKREEYLADAFQALGQVMHLIADSACPPHVRNDAHPPWEASPYETYCENNATKITFSNPSFAVPGSIFQTSLVPGMEPITNLWDTDNSAGYNTAIGSNSPNIGLAEYTNYNFFSKDTVFDPVYTYPSTSMAAQGVVIQDPGTGDESYYFSGTTSDGVPVTHYAKMDYFYTDLTTSLEQSKISLDEECFGDYANILVPKAVNYNAALLDYFFRGKMDVTPTQYYMSSGYVTGVDLSVKNITLLDPADTNTGQTMSNGIFVAAYRYKIDAADTTYQYGRSKEINSGTISYDNNPATLLTFADFSRPVPTDADVVEYALVFKGDLGNEQEAVVSQSFDPIWIEDWERGVSGRHNWFFMLDYNTYSLISNPGGTSGDQVILFDVDVTGTRYTNLLLAQATVISPTGGRLSTDKYKTVTMDFYVYGTSGSAIRYYESPILNVSLYDPQTGNFVRSVRTPFQYFSGQSTDTWLQGVVDLSSYPSLEIGYISLWLEGTLYTNIWSSDIVFGDIIVK